MTPKDLKIIEAIMQGKDDKVLNSLYETSFRKIRDYVRKNSGSQQDAEDIFQDAIIGLYRMVKGGKYDERYDVDAFLFIVGKNLWINKAKREQRSVGLPDDYQLESSQYNPMMEEERDQQIRQTFEKIGEKCKELLTLVVYFDHSMKELCTKLGYPNENAAKTQHYKCKQKLIELVGASDSFKQLLKDAI